MSKATHTQKGRVLVVDDEANARTALAELLREEGYAVETAADGFKALGKLDDFAPDVMLTDLKMPGMDGLALLRKARERDDELVVLVMTAFGAVETAVGAMKEGAADYLTKPLNMAELQLVLSREMERHRLRREAGELRARLADRYRFENVVGTAPAMQEVLRTLVKVAPARTNLLFLGEPGTGRALLAAAVHQHSPRAKRPFLRVPCGALGEADLAAELFGDLATGRRGRLADAEGGTLFLDEVAALPPALQARLLEVLQPPALDTGAAPDVRIIAATTRDLSVEAAEGRFRSELTYRLGVVSLQLPALRERIADIPLLATHFLHKFAQSSGRTFAGFSDTTLQVLCSYVWPGNVRELESVIERAAAVARGRKITPADLPPHVVATQVPLPIRIPGSTLEQIERFAILKAMEATGGSTSKAADMLGISVRKIQYKLHQYGAAPKSGAAVVPPKP